MPEIGEVARTVHFLRKHLLNRTLTSVTARDDPIVYGKTGTSSTAFAAALTNRRVIDAAQQGKYFYLLFDRPPHAVLHFGMTGWMKFDAEETGYYKQGKVVEGEGGTEEWPPRFVKFLLRCEAEPGPGGRGAVEAAFVDARRLARIRLVDCEAGTIRETTPLKENGPDPVRDKEVVTKEWLGALLGRKRVPVKALLLDQANISGVGNWVADEVLYQARIHPEQYSNSFADAQVAALHKALIGVCTTAVETLADSEQFPEDWLMKFRWNKGKKDGNVLPNGDKIVHLKVGGRTSAVVPNRQKKTGAVAGDVAEEDDDAGEAKAKPAKPAKGTKRKPKSEHADEDEGEAESKPAPKKGRGRQKKQADEESEHQANGGATADKPAKSEDVVPAKKGKPATPKKAEKPVATGSRRSTRNK